MAGERKLTLEERIAASAGKGYDPGKRIEALKSVELTEDQASLAGLLPLDLAKGRVDGKSWADLDDTQKTLYVEDSARMLQAILADGQGIAFADGWKPSGHHEAPAVPNSAPGMARGAQAAATALHDLKMSRLQADGWSYGERYDEEAKTTPAMVPFGTLRVLGIERRQCMAVAGGLMDAIASHGATVYRHMQPESERSPYAKLAAKMEDGGHDGPDGPDGPEL